MSVAVRAGKIFSGAVLAQSFSLLMAPVLTRLLDQSAFGVYQLYLSMASFSLVSIGCLDQLVLAQPSPRVRRSIIRLAGWGGAFLVATVWLVGLIVGFAWGILDDPWMALIFAIAPFGVYVSGMWQVMSNWIIAEGRIRTATANRCLQAVGQSGGQSGLSFVVAGPSALILGDILAKILACVALLRKVEPRSLCWNKRALLLRLYRDRRHVLIASPGNIFNTLSFAMPIALLAHAYSLTELGLLAIIIRLMEAPGQMLGRAVSLAVMPEVTKIHDSGAWPLRWMIIKAISALFAIGLVPAALVAGIGPDVFGFVLGQEWRAAGELAGVIAWPWLVSFAVWPIGSLLNILGHPGKMFIWEFSRFLVVVPVLLWGIHVQHWQFSECVHWLWLMYGCASAALLAGILVVCGTRHEKLAK